MLPALETALERLPDRIVVYDLNTLAGRVHGWLSGVRRAPSVLVAGHKHIGLAAARSALQRAVERAPASEGSPQ